MESGATMRQNEKRMARNSGTEPAPQHADHVKVMNWKEENRKAPEAFNRYIDEHGISLANGRQSHSSRIPTSNSFSPAFEQNRKKQMKFAAFMLYLT